MPLRGSMNAQETKTKNDDRPSGKLNEHLDRNCCNSGDHWLIGTCPKDSVAQRNVVYGRIISRRGSGSKGLGRQRRFRIAPHGPNAGSWIHSESANRLVTPYKASLLAQ
jgi:hypothetical protein